MRIGLHQALLLRRRWINSLHDLRCLNLRDSVPRFFLSLKMFEPYGAVGNSLLTASSPDFQKPHLQGFQLRDSAAQRKAAVPQKEASVGNAPFLQDRNFVMREFCLLEQLLEAGSGSSAHSPIGLLARVDRPCVPLPSLSLGAPPPLLNEFLFFFGHGANSVRCLPEGHCEICLS